jgi:hypothetical protein
MADLLGGTTGQVLAKASNTDMDFSWVTTDDTNAIQNAIVDAKGDLIAASAADTPARLAVGANDLVLTAASGEATGLKYAGAWTSYTPTWVGITVGNATITTKYCQVGKLVTVSIKLVVGSTTSFPSGYVQVSGPITGVTMPSRILGRVYYEDAGVAAYLGAVKQDAASVFAIVPEIVSGTYPTFGNTSSTVPFTFGTGDIIEAYFSYEAA